MDCAKVGGLILQLRQEKGLTQREVAERLGISNKTVSKWECGLGCPDASLWDGLSEVLGADILKMLQGELRPNRPDVGKMSRVRFYACPVCLNLLVSTGESAISCCGRKLSPLVGRPHTEEHTVKVEEVDLEYYVTLNHPMEKGHYLVFAAYVHDDRVLLQRLYPEQSASFSLPLTRRGGKLYLYCSEHGLQTYPFTL